MKVALVVPKIGTSLPANLARIEKMSQDAVSAGAEFILLPEAVLTGLANNGDPAHDLPLGEAVPGPSTDRLSTFCRQNGVWLGLGLLEREENRLYDSAALIAPDGHIAFKYRRNQPQWHTRQADPSVYREGTNVGSVDCPIGRVGFLICGDLFDDEILGCFQKLKCGWLLFPFARCFSDGSADQERWDSHEFTQYAERIKELGVPALMVNYLADSSLGDDYSFGGACVVSARGEVLASHPLGVEGILYVDTENLPGAGTRTA